MFTNQLAKFMMDSESGQNVKSEGETSTALRERTLHSGSKKVNARFKSPVQVSSMQNKRVCVEDEITELQNTILQLESNIIELESEGVCVHELDLHINQLHEYNNIKDIAQTLLGKLAGLRSVTTRDLYVHFGMELDD